MVFMLQLTFQRIFCQIVITAQNFKKTVIFQTNDGFKNQRIPIQNVNLPGPSFGTGPSSKIVILTTLFRKNVNIGVQILQTVPNTLYLSTQFVNGLLVHWLKDTMEQLREEMFDMELKLSNHCAQCCRCETTRGILQQGFLNYKFLHF